MENLNANLRELGRSTGGDTLKTYAISQMSKHETKQLKKITPNI